MVRTATPLLAFTLAVVVLGGCSAEVKGPRAEITPPEIVVKSTEPGGEFCPPGQAMKGACGDGRFCPPGQAKKGRC